MINISDHPPKENKNKTPRKIPTSETQTEKRKTRRQGKSKRL
jgi:hypothetical protein